MHQQMGTKKLSENFFAIQDLESRRFLLRVLENPTNLITHIKTEASAIILKITYGYSIEPHKGDPLVSLIERMMDHLSRALVPLAWPVDTFTFLKYLPSGLPGTSFQKIGRQWREINHMVAEVPYAFVQRQMGKRAFRPSYVASLVEQYSEEGNENWRLQQDDEEAIKNTAAILYGAGADTTVSTITSFVLAMLLFPEVQLVAQKEIDNIVGGDRLPGFEDRAELPYVNALVKETLRWLPVVPIGTTHVTEEEITYSGYRIPKGAYILPSIWGILHDPETHPNPDTFYPERFLEPRNEPDPANHVYGYGRRICPGRHLADDSIFLTISRLLATFDVTKAVDNEGREIDVKVEVTPGLITRPINFSYSIKPRSTKHLELVRSSEIDHPWEEGDSVHLEMDSLRDPKAGSV
ncbi:hypothetical protein QQX98_002353 [Neonectria punicea]|uniref:O-methylsterigmatocystin oxidoreductase n=1 Tax=Neonectria punicea TaxID=979145 RepID=A0ABR1HJ40_9HYPO